MVLPSEIMPSQFLWETEFGLTAIAVLAAFIWPKLGGRFLNARSAPLDNCHVAEEYRYM